MYRNNGKAIRKGLQHAEIANKILNEFEKNKFKNVFPHKNVGWKRAAAW